MQRPFNRVNSKTYWKSAWNRNDGKKIEKIRISNGNCIQI